MNKTDLIDKVKALDGLSQDVGAYLINLVNTKNKYGLVWEDKPEKVEEQLREKVVFMTFNYNMKGTYSIRHSFT